MSMKECGDHKQKRQNRIRRLCACTSVPIAPFIGEALNLDQANGGIQMMIKINGRVRWKVGAFVSGRYHLHVTCPVYIPYGSKNDNFDGETSIKVPLLASCAVSV
ncbi:hypothetical protein ACET3Z_016081 [Daucus carota]